MPFAHYAGLGLIFRLLRPAPVPSPRSGQEMVAPGASLGWWSRLNHSPRSGRKTRSGTVELPAKVNRSDAMRRPLPRPAAPNHTPHSLPKPPFPSLFSEGVQHILWHIWLRGRGGSALIHFLLGVLMRFIRLAGRLDEAFRAALLGYCSPAARHLAHVRWAVLFQSSY